MQSKVIAFQSKPMDWVPENVLPKKWEDDRKIAEFFAEFYRVNLENVGHSSSVSMPKNSPQVFGWVFFCVKRVRVLINMF